MDEVDGQRWIDAALDVVEERAEDDRVLLAGDQLGQHLARVHVERGEQ
ncbi:MAG: hypothetical protein ACRDZN_13790 [Acidimicrobiales bacterium]